ncbi:hypothetical protein [Botrimarina mediterranea]|uniref:hypothetical protein n=1 Tax=Botrimarina mediterranea TaxID=2528022 RepID=UPI001188D547|nr:hypothetical protein K2D_16840 [Planctomycetes bacterium K2D]
MGSIVLDQLNANPDHQVDFFDDFVLLDVVGRWTNVSGDTGAEPTLATDGKSDVLLTTGATNNNECYLTSNLLFDLAVGQQVLAEAKVLATEAATDDLNFIFGIVSGAGANALQDDGGGPPASYSGACIFKVDGGTTWNLESSVGGSQTTSTTTLTSAQSTYQLLRILIDVVSATEAEVSFMIGQEGGNFFRLVTDSNGQPIKHTINPTSFAAANVVIGAKAGGAASEVPRVDYVRVSQTK